MLPDLPSLPESEPEPKQVFSSNTLGITPEDFLQSEVGDASHSGSEPNIDDFQVETNNLALRQIPLPIMAVYIFIYLSSVIVNPNMPWYPWSSMSRKEENWIQTENQVIHSTKWFTLLFTHDHWQNH